MQTRCSFLLVGGLLAWLGLNPRLGSAQQKPTGLAVTAQSAPKVYTYVEQMPSFPGGLVALNDYLKQNSRYAPQVQRSAAAARVFVRFLIEASGQLTHIELAKGSSTVYDQEALRLVQAMPRWRPGRQNGQLVTVQYILPLSFGKPE